MTIVTGDRSLRLVATAFDAYRRIFVGSGLAPLLSQPNPVRHTGFDLDLVVERVEVEATDVLSVTLGAADGAPLPRWQPGAHLDVFLPSGRQRQYSLCGDPGDPGDPRRYRIAVRLLHAGGGGSREIHESLRVGDPLRVRGPRNAFRLVTADSYTFVAGGIGITPILPMVKAVAARGVPWRMTYLGRTRASMPFLAELPGDVDVRPDDETGRPDLAALLAGTRPGGAVYVCGPPPLLDAARPSIPPDRCTPNGSRRRPSAAAPPSTWSCAAPA